MGTSYEAINAFATAGITITARHMDRKKADLAELHDDLINTYLNRDIRKAMILDIDDYHNIHAERTLDTCSTSPVSHMTTLMLNSIETDAISIYGPNGVSVHNHALIDPLIISKYLDEKYMRVMTVTFSERFYHDDSMDARLNVLNLHSYDDRMKSRQEERRMKDCMLLD